MKKTFKLLVMILSAMTLGLALNSCDNSTSPADYKKDYYVEAYLFVDNPIEGIKVMSTQPVNQRFSYDNSMVKNAVVTISTNEQTMQLVYRDGENAGYYSSNDTYKVQPNTEYKITVKTADGKVLTGETVTPSRFEWTVNPKPVMQYPSDTLNLRPVDSLNIAWTKGKGNGDFYLIQTICHDTLDYGKYIDPSSNEKNRRTYNFLTKTGDAQNYYKNITNWAMVANIKTPTVWLAFKWFGKHTLKIYSPDMNMMKWFVNFVMTGSSYTNPNCNSIKGGFGVFGSAAFISSEIFLKKNSN